MKKCLQHAILDFKVCGDFVCEFKTVDHLKILQNMFF